MLKNKLILPYHKYLNHDSLIMNHENSLKNLNTSIINETANRFNYLIRLGKDKLNNFEKIHIVYQIKCQNCEYVYIGQSKRKLKKRIKEHEKAHNKKSINSVLYTHTNNTNHKFDFNKVKIFSLSISCKISLVTIHTFSHKL